MFIIQATGLIVYTPLGLDQVGVSPVLTAFCAPTCTGATAFNRTPQRRTTFSIMTYSRHVNCDSSGQLKKTFFSVIYATSVILPEALTQVTQLGV